MKRILLDPNCLIPTDHPRSLLGVIRFIPDFCSRRKVRPVLVIPTDVVPRDATVSRYFVCSGNHRAAAAYICGVRIEADVIETTRDLAKIDAGTAASCSSIEQLLQLCRDAAEGGGYLDGRWTEYLRMITDSGVVGFDERETVRKAEMAHRAGPQATSLYPRHCSPATTRDGRRDEG